MNDYPVRNYSRDSIGRQLTGMPGALINILDECLVNGGEDISISSITVSNNVATANLNYRIEQDPLFANVGGLLHCEGTNNGTTLTDSSGVITAFNFAAGSVTSTSQYKFGTSSLYLPNVGSYVTLANSNYWNMGALNFCLEFWVKVAVKAAGVIFQQMNTSYLTCYMNSSGVVYVTFGASITYYIPTLTGTTDIATDGNWHHVAISRSGLTHYLFIDGNLEASYTGPYVSIYPVNSTPFYFGDGSTAVRAYYDELRITIGYARYTSSFTPQTVPYPDKKCNTPLANQIITISGATNYTEFNDNFLVSTNSSDYKTITFPITTAHSNPTGTLKLKMPSLGWQKVWSASNKAVYRSQDQTGTRHYLRVDDTNYQTAIATMYDDMADIDTGTPATTNPVYWKKSQVSTTAVRNWHLIGDSKTFYLFAYWDSGGPYLQMCYVFGDIKSPKPADKYNCIIIGSETEPVNAAQAHTFCFARDATKINGQWISKAYNQMGPQVNFYKTTGCGLFNSNSVMGNSVLLYPNTADAGLHLFPVYVIEIPAVRVYRGQMRGLRSPAECTGSSSTVVFQNRDVVSIGDDKYIHYRIATEVSGAAWGSVFFDLIGPWE